MRPEFIIADSAEASGGSRLDAYLSARAISIFFNEPNTAAKKKKKKKKYTRPVCFLVLVYKQISCLASSIKDKCSRGSKTRVQELCESRGGRPGLSVLTSLLVSVDVNNY